MQTIQEVYLLPIIISDSGNPPLSSTSTLTIRVCGCSSDGVVQSCNVEAYVLPIGLSMGALIAILACIILLLGTYFLHSLMVTIFLHNGGESGDGPLCGYNINNYITKPPDLQIQASFLQ
uniref:Uncharacterized protein n=1 Tax=Sus scrofa TaxID=9823 RepID=A0A8D1B6E7_PIG